MSFKHWFFVVFMSHTPITLRTGKHIERTPLRRGSQSRERQNQSGTMASTAARDMYAGALTYFQQQLQAAGFENLAVARVQDLLVQVAHQYEGFERELR